MCKQLALLPLLLLVMGCTQLQTIANPQRSPKTRLANLEDVMASTLDGLSRARASGFIDDDSQRQIAQYREVGYAIAFEARGLVGSDDLSSLEDRITKLQDIVDKLAGFQRQADLMTKPVSAAQYLNDMMPAFDASQPAHAGGESAVAYAVFLALTEALKLWGKKSAQAAREGRDLTDEEAAEISGGLDLAVIKNRALDPQD